MNPNRRTQQDKHTHTQYQLKQNTFSSSNIFPLGNQKFP